MPPDRPLGVPVLRGVPRELPARLHRQRVLGRHHPLPPGEPLELRRDLGLVLLEEPDRVARDASPDPQVPQVGPHRRSREAYGPLQGVPVAAAGVGHMALPLVELREQVVGRPPPQRLLGQRQQPPGHALHLARPQGQHAPREQRVMVVAVGLLGEHRGRHPGLHERRRDALVGQELLRPIPVLPQARAILEPKRQEEQEVPKAARQGQHRRRVADRQNHRPLVRRLAGLLHETERVRRRDPEGDQLRRPAGRPAHQARDRVRLREPAYPDLQPLGRRHDGVELRRQALAYAGLQALQGLARLLALQKAHTVPPTSRNPAGSRRRR